MIRELDLTLAGWLDSVLDTDDGASVTFDPVAPPDTTSAAKSKPKSTGSVVALELYDVRLDADASTAGWASVRDERGVEVGRVPPAKTYRFTYLLTVHASDALAEHDILGRILTAAARHEIVPEVHLVGALAESGQHVLLRCAPARPLTDTHERRHREEVRRVALELSVLASLPQAGVGDLPAPPSQVELGTRRRVIREAPDPHALVPRPTTRISEGH